MSDKSITVYDIAERAGVSPATVSRVITGKARVREDKAERVREAMEALAYRPNLMARNLQTRESKTLGVILPDISNPFFSEFYLELEREALTRGYTMFLCNTMNNSFQELGDVESLYLRSLVERRVDGIVFMGGRINTTKPDKAHAQEMIDIADQVPLVMVNGRMPGMDGYLVKTDERAGIIAMIEYQIAQGHKELALLGGFSGMVPADLKIRAFKDVIKKHDLPLRNQWIIPSGFSVQAGEQAIATILKLGRRPSAVVCVNDYVAIGVLRGALEAGLAIPDDLSISGFDNISMTAHTYPALSTVSHDFPTLATKTVDTLLALKAGQAPAKKTELPMQLVIRESIRSV
ncbi:MAG: LacI family transcriptional regulator [Cytophagales bacterium]|nr:LacI family transcriptional regulator [Cytophagales bacterium]